MAIAGSGGRRLFGVFLRMSGIIPLTGRGENSMTYPMTVNRDGAADQVERFPPGIAVSVITGLSLVCWMSLISTGMAMWSAFN
jgi:hypothetical protein